jgi:hypothetical protein
MEHEPVGTTTTRHSAAYLLHFVASQAAWRVVRKAKHVSSIAIARTLGRFPLRHADFAIFVRCYQSQTLLYTDSSTHRGWRKRVRHEDVCVHGMLTLSDGRSYRDGHDSGQSAA